MLRNLRFLYPGIDKTIVNRNISRAHIAGLIYDHEPTDLAKMGFLERWNRNKNNSERVYTERRPLETIGSIIFVFCKPLFVIGIILTIVIYTEKDPTDSISSFRIIGPVFLSLSAVFFVFGGFMTSPYFPLVLERCKRKKNTSSSIAATGVNKEEPAVKTVRVHPLKTADPVNV